LNLIEAIESCLPFRRAGQPDWKTRFSVEYRLTHSSVGGLYGTQLQQLAKVEKHVIDLSLTDLLAKDWETKGPSISITKGGTSPGHGTRRFRGRLL